MINATMEYTDRLDELIVNLQKHRDILKDRMAELNSPSLDFDIGIPPVLAADKQATATRTAIMDTAAEIEAIVKGPEFLLTLPSHNVWTSLHIVVRLGLATAIKHDSDEGKTFEELGQLASPPLDPDMVKRIFRHITTLHIFKESPLGTIRHNAASRYLAQSPDMRGWLENIFSGMLPFAYKTADALQKWPRAQEPNQSAFQIAHQTDLPVFEYFGQYPEVGKNFATAMTWFATSPGFEVTHAVDGYPWAELAADSKVVDIGGSHGEVGLAVTQRFPKLNYVIQDLGHVVERARESLPAGTSNVSFMAHNFFEEQPVKGASVYFLKWICHDWSDEYASKIFGSIIPAMGDHSRIVIMDYIVPEPGQVAISHERYLRAFDIAMLGFQNGKERDVADWKKLFALTDPRLELTRTFHPKGSNLGIVEARLKSS